MLIKTVTSQHNSQHGKGGVSNDMAKYANGRIPFADAPNPPATAAAAAAAPTAQYGSQQHKTPGSKQLKTPGSQQYRTPGPAGKSSPQYTPGEHIELPDIHTDSEDEDSDDEKFEVPQWAESPFLNEALRQQQLVDPQQIFGPIAPLRMEELFKDNKDRLKKLRVRGSSAHWGGPDRLTDSERKRDQQARELMEVDGGWDYQHQKAAMSRRTPSRG
jgi:hypothetical protein